LRVGLRRAPNAPALVEREEALRIVAECMRRATGGAGNTVLLSGEAGIGKTSLLRALAAQFDDVRLWWGACDALQTPHPLAPLYDIARAEDVGFGTQLRVDCSRTALFESVIAELQEERRPTLFVVEDAHWADEATLDLLKFLGRRIDRTPCLLAISYRNDEVTAAHPLRRVIGELGSGVTRVELERLSAEAVAKLAQSALQSPRGIHEATQGNPFFVTELLRSGGGAMPLSVQDLVLGRFARLSSDAQDVLRLVSITPRQIEFQLLEQILPAGVRQVDECLNSGLIEAAGGALRFRHELAQAVIENSLSKPAAERLHRRVLQALESRQEPAQAARLAHHALRAGDERAVLRYAPAAAREAAQHRAHREAVAHYGAALACASAVGNPERVSWLEDFARECQFTAQLEEAIDARRMAAELHRQASNTIGEAHNFSELAMAYVRALRMVEADDASMYAVKLLEGLAPSAQLAHAYRIQAHIHMLRRDCTQAIDWSNKAIELAETFGARDTLAAALGVLGAATQFVEYEAGCTHLRRAFDIADVEGLDFMAAVILNNLATGSGEVFRFREAREQFLQAVEFAKRRDIDSAASYATAWLAMCEMYLGNWEEAQKCAFEVIGGKDRTISRVTALVALARVNMRRGERGVSELLEEAGAFQYDWPVISALAEAALLRGDSAGAIACAKEGLAEEGLWSEWLTGELAYLLWRAGASNIPNAPVARPFKLQIEGRFREAAAAWAWRGCPFEQARALAEGDTDAQLEALEIFDRLGAHPSATDLRRQLRAKAVRGVPRGLRASTRANPHGLTQREIEVLALLCEGFKNAEIAERLCLSVRTVDHHLAAAFTKMGVSNRAEAVAAALRLLER
jgi:DNA-binding CsgD family transcriptional regulator/tetratricopeptide (TPR) repeat protein